MLVEMPYYYMQQLACKHGADFATFGQDGICLGSVSSALNYLS